MRIWLLTIGEPLPVDGPDERLFRTGILAQTLARRGHEVTWWTSAFDHVRKRFRAPETSSVSWEGVDAEIVLLRGTGYARNISLQRMRDHRAVAREFARLASGRPLPDVILCSIPIVELATEALKVGPPVALDCRDMWPDIFADSVPGAARPLARLALNGMERETRAAFRQAAAVLGHTLPFVEWGLGYAERSATPLDRDFPFGYEAPAVSAEQLADAERFWDEQGVAADDSRVRLCFFGAVGHQFRFDALRDLPDMNAQFVICGEGESAPMLREAAARHSDRRLVVPGWVDRPKITALMARSHLGFAPYNDEPMYRASIPNKAIEYWSGGLPIAWQVPQGIVADLIREHGVGLIFRDLPDLARQIAALTESGREAMRANARRLFDERFRAEAVYRDFADHLERIAGSK